MILKLLLVCVLAGCWAGNNGHAEFHEQWMKPAGSMMPGMSRTLVDEKITAYESMRIHALADGSIAFTPQPSGKAEVTFMLRNAGEREMQFEVQREEFPQRVIYRLDADGSLHARIEGMREGKIRGIRFPDATHSLRLRTRSAHRNGRGYIVRTTPTTKPSISSADLSRSTTIGRKSGFSAIR
jgi:hypothetical protein